ncbi:hypothetical protein [Clostridium sp. UBA4548]|uniref:hypothetical protein n=1 Tax=Clostridium sp. UBA4548 TaxID=1946361 RepID=UPI0025C024FB|nr:hypothetical protein [Clostridium sp. UBA4548]
MERVKYLKGEIEKVIAHELDIDECVQDASFFTELTILEESQREQKNKGNSYAIINDLSIRFSSFGNMVTIYGNTKSNLDNIYPMKNIINILEQNGFIYINAESLDKIYDGVNKYISKKDTWWIRYFDYL